MGRAMASVLCTHPDGGVMFKVFLGGEGSANLSAEQRLALKNFCIICGAAR